MERPVFDAFVGIDQTGAVGPRGTPRPLPAAMLVREGERARLVVRALPSASREAVATWAEGEGVSLGRVAVVVDAVLGLPSGCWPAPAAGLVGGDRPWSLFTRAAAEPGFGRAAGERFFASLVPHALSGALPRRACEVLAGANSVFVTRPFQRNVQTGTFRIWKDLGGGARWANVWPFDARASLPRAPWLFEGYPSLLWARVFGERTRAPARFPSVLARAAELGVRAAIAPGRVREVAGSPDLADAAVLALGAACLDRANALVTPAPGLAPGALAAGEGWIVGLAHGGNRFEVPRVVPA